MNIWEIYTDSENNIILDCEEKENDKIDLFTWIGESVKNDWDDTFELYIEKNRGFQSNMPYFGKLFLMGDKKLSDIFIEQACDDVEILKVVCEDREYYIINIITIIDCINMEKSKYKVFKACPDKIMTYNKLVINTEKINSPVFRPYQVESGLYLCTDEFKNIIEKENIKGVCFRQMDVSE